MQKTLALHTKFLTLGHIQAREVWDFIKQHTPQEAVILFHKPRVLYLNTGRIAFASNNIARFDEVDFVLWEVSLWEGYGGINIDSSDFIERTNLIFQNAQFRLFRVKNDLRLNILSKKRDKNCLCKIDFAKNIAPMSCY